MDLKQVRDHKNSKHLAKRCFTYIETMIKSQQYEVVSVNTFKMLSIDNIAILSISPFKFIGNFENHYTHDQLQQLSKYVKGRNKGHRFEELTAQALNNVDFKISGIKYNENLSEEESKVVSELEKVFDKMTKEDMRKVKDYENSKSISGDFIGEVLSISCKRKTSIIKHPKLNKEFLLYNKYNLNNNVSLPFGEGFMNNENNLSGFRALSNNTGDTTIAKKINEETFRMLMKLNGGNVLELYNFLIGKDKPLIITQFPNKLTFTHLGFIDDPTELSFEMREDKLVINFNNGISLERRVKSGINSRTSKRWYDAYKSEWKLLKTDKVISNTKTVIL